MDSAHNTQLISLLDELRKAVEELLLAGLTTASKSTVERLDVTFKEASRMKLLRLGSTLRIANEEISRFTTGSPQFSPRRLTFFLNRAWLLATSMRRAMKANDSAALDRLMATTSSQPVAKLKAVTLGVSKRVVPGAFASFDFRLRAIEPAAPIEDGESLIWSCVFPMRKDLDLPTEAFLHLPQKQKFKPSLLLEKKIVEISKCAVNRSAGTATRLMLGDASEMKSTEEFADWNRFCQWNAQDAAARLELHRPTPLDLEIEFQEEVFLTDWQPAELKSTEESYDVLPIQSEFLNYSARLDRGPSGIPMRDTVQKMAKEKTRPPIFGIAHYEACQIIMQPLTAFEKDGPVYLTVSPEKISQAELVKAMKFT